MELTYNENVNWNDNEYKYDEKGNPHRWYVNVNKTQSYEFEDGDLQDDVLALQSGYIFFDYEDEYATS